MSAYDIYGLEDPRTNKVRYVGLSKDVQKRFKQHMNPRKMASWIHELFQLGLKPNLLILESNILDLATARKREQHWIHHYEGIGWDLENFAGNEAAHSYRDEQAGLYNGLLEKYSEYLPLEKAHKLARMTVEGYNAVGGSAWEVNYNAVVGTLKFLPEKFNVHHNLDEIDAAILTFTMFGIEWQEEGEVEA